jgi:hypothetical protein
LLLAVLPALGQAEELGGGLQLDLRAYINLEVGRQTTAEGKGDPHGSLDADVAELLVMARRGALRGSIALDVEHGADTERGLGTVNLGFGFLEYSFADAIRLRAGKILNPFGFYNEIHSVKSGYPAVKEASSTLKPYRLSGNGFRYSPKWEAGVAALGSFPVGQGSLDYVVSVANGENVALGKGQPDAYDTNPYDEDNNVDKSVTARVRYAPLEGLTVGASFYRAGLTEVVADVRQDGSLLSYGAFAHYVADDWDLFAEINRGRLNPTAGGAVATELGWVGSVGYRIDDRWMPFVQVERVATQRGGADDWGMAGVLGVNMTLVEGLLIKVEYDQLRGSAGNTLLGTLPHRGYGEVRGALVAAF